MIKCTSLVLSGLLLSTTLVYAGPKIVSSPGTNPECL